MEPQIQFANTEDGVSIAYWTMGVGPAVVSVLRDFEGPVKLWELR